MGTLKRNLLAASIFCPLQFLGFQQLTFIGRQAFVGQSKAQSTGQDWRTNGYGHGYCSNRKAWLRQYSPSALIVWLLAVNLNWQLGFWRKISRQIHRTGGLTATATAYGSKSKGLAVSIFSIHFDSIASCSQPSLAAKICEGNLYPNPPQGRRAGKWVLLPAKKVLRPSCYFRITPISASWRSPVLQLGSLTCPVALLTVVDSLPILHIVTIEK